MNKILLYPTGISESCRCAAALLETSGLSLIDHPSPDITHVLWDVPSFRADGLFRNGDEPEELLRMLPNSVTVIGGKLDHPLLEKYRKIDLLEDQTYLAQNAAITAECALQTAAAHMKTTFCGTSVLVLGWGRIGKCLAKLLASLGAKVTVAARKESDRAMLKALGYQAADFSQLAGIIQQYRLLFNTVPDLCLQEDITEHWSGGSAIDLASDPGMRGANVIPARGLPGKYAPESSGQLIAETILRILKEDVK